jgi:hypothetical protein
MTASHRLLPAALGWLLLASPLPAWAHSRAPSAPGDGIAIPNLTHGQMAVIAGYRAAILDLAARQSRTDPVLRRLRNFADIQHTYCLWGMVPGSLGDERSPFNECTHAYLAATQALLLHMRAIGGDPAGPANALAARIETDMLRNSASLVLCRHSGEAFNTADIISPRWSEIPSHTGSLASLALLAFVVSCTIGFLRRMTAAARPGR